MTKDSSLTNLLGEDRFQDKVKNLSFEESMSNLEKLVAQVESGKLALDQAVKAYEVGAALIEHSRKLLAGAEKKLKVLEKG